MTNKANIVWFILFLSIFITVVAVGVASVFYGECDACNQKAFLKEFKSETGAVYHYCGTCTDYAKFFE